MSFVLVHPAAHDCFLHLFSSLQLSIFFCLFSDSFSFLHNSIPNLFIFFLFFSFSLTLSLVPLPIFYSFSWPLLSLSLCFPIFSRPWPTTVFPFYFLFFFFFFFSLMQVCNLQLLILFIFFLPVFRLGLPLFKTETELDRTCNSAQPNITAQ